MHKFQSLSSPRVTHGTCCAWARVEIPLIIASIRRVPGWLYVTYHHRLYQQELQPALSLYNGCAICECPTLWSEATHLTQTQGAGHVLRGHHRLYQQELQPALSLYNCCAICERPTFWSEPTHLTQTQGADMHCVDSRDGMSTPFLVCPSIIQCAKPNHGQDGRKALALALARALAESTRMQPLNDILRARQ